MVNFNLAGSGFFIAAGLFFIAWIAPAFAGRPRSATFLSLAVVFFVLGLAARRKSEPPGSAGA